MMGSISIKARRLMDKILHARAVDMRKVYQWHEIRLLQRLFVTLEVDCVFDVGANRGQYARMLRKKVKYKNSIISAEPNPDAYRRLQVVAAPDPKWDVRNVAVGVSDGLQEFSIMVGDQFSTLSNPITVETSELAALNSVSRRLTVKVTSLQSIFDEARERLNFRRPFLKLDTQGYDHLIVRAARETAQQFVGIQSELSFKRIYEHSVAFQESLGLFEKMGFSLCAIVPNNEGHFPLLIEQDAIFINNKFT